MDCPGRMPKFRIVPFLIACLPVTAQTYPGPIHQELTFLAAKQLSHCLQGTDIPPLGPLEVRYIVKRDVSEAERSIFRRMLQWRYYDRRQKARGFLGIVETRLHEHYNKTARALRHADSLRERYTDLGILVHYLQEVTVPAHVIPIFNPRVWRLIEGDTMDKYPLDKAAVEARLGGLCKPLFADQANDFKQLLVETAEHTRAAAREPIPGLPADWTAFWRDDADPSDFGEYGPAGNRFGLATSFRCGPDRRARCHLVDDDPIYGEFATARHVDAVLATMRAMLMAQKWFTRQANATPP